MKLKKKINMKKYSKYHFLALLFTLAAGLACVSCAEDIEKKEAKSTGKSNFSFSITDIQDTEDTDTKGEPNTSGQADNDDNPLSRAADDADKDTYRTRTIDFNEPGTEDICLEETTVPGVNAMKRTPETRGRLKNFIDADFGVSACTNYWGGPDFFFNERVSRHGEMVNPISWSSSQTSLQFIAVYPYIDGSNNNEYIGKEYSTGNVEVSFHPSTDIAKQTDLMVAVSDRINYKATGGAPHVVPLKFSHVLTAIRFGIGQNVPLNKTIKSIEINGVYGHAYLNAHTKRWHSYMSTASYKLDNINQSTNDAMNTVFVKDGNTFLLLPQRLPNAAEIIVNFTDGNKITANIGGKWWEPGTTKTYMISRKSPGGAYKIETTNPSALAYNQTQSNAYTIKSYRQDPLDHTFHPVGWKVVGYQVSYDGGLTWSPETSKPAWLTNLSLTQGTGGTAAESGTAKVRKDTVNLVKKRNEELRNAQPKGTSANPYNLANQTNGGPTVQNTANCYVISAPGWYRIPLVYGNAIHTVNGGSVGVDNTRAYKTNNTGAHILSNFKDHNNQDITSPWITLTNGGANVPDGAKLVWANELYQVENLSLSGTGKNAFVNFEVPARFFESGNAVIAVTKGGTVVWSWHLWFAPQNVLDKIPCINFGGKTYYFAKEPLGFRYDIWNATTYSDTRCVRIRVQQTEKSGANYAESFITIRQKPYSRRQGDQTYYQGFRKDPIPSYGAYVGYYNETWEEHVDIGKTIRNPNIYYASKRGQPSLVFINPFDVYLNTWSMDNKVEGANDNRVVKTIYDPCPVGFHVPAPNAFTGFSKTGLSSYSNTQQNFNIKGKWDFGYTFYVNPYSQNDNDISIWCPATGVHGAVYPIRRGNINHSCTYWTAGVKLSTQLYDGFCLDFSITPNHLFLPNDPNGGHTPPFGFGIRAVSDQR